MLLRLLCLARLFAFGAGLIMLIVSTMLAAGCTTGSDKEKTNSDQVFNGSSSSNSDIYHLQKQGVSVDRMGENIMITIPSALLFNGYTATLSDSADTTLSMVADIIEPMTKVSVNISAYSATAKQSKKDLLITDLQAQNVAHRLWRLGVDARLIYATGMGGGHLVSTNDQGQPSGSAINARVVIALRDLSDN